MHSFVVIYVIFSVNGFRKDIIFSQTLRTNIQFDIIWYISFF